MLSRSRVYSHTCTSQWVWRANRVDSVDGLGSEWGVARLGGSTELVDPGLWLVRGHFLPRKKWNLVAPVKTHNSSLALATFAIALATIVIATLVLAALLVAVVVLSCTRSRHVGNHCWPLLPSSSYLLLLLVVVFCARRYSPIALLCQPWCSPFLTRTHHYSFCSPLFCYYVSLILFFIPSESFLFYWCLL